MKLSIIIPTYNEATYIGRLLDRLISNSGETTEIIVVDGGSKDATISIVNSFDVKLLETEASRAKQLNLGAENSTFDNLYFVHADTLPPKSFIRDISYSTEMGMEACCYRTKFEERRLLMRLNEFHSRFLKLYFRGGDQSLSISKKLFNELGRFDEEMCIMEEYPILQKLMNRKKFRVVPKDILISSRKYDKNSWLKVTRANLIAYRMFKKGQDSSVIKDTYLTILSLNEF
jgi:rSAM/selenodomain-associated transferase 2